MSQSQGRRTGDAFLWDPRAVTCALSHSTVWAQYKAVEPSATMLTSHTMGKSGNILPFCDDLIHFKSHNGDRYTGPTSSACQVHS